MIGEEPGGDTGFRFPQLCDVFLAAFVFWSWHLLRVWIPPRRWLGFLHYFSNRRTWRLACLGGWGGGGQNNRRFWRGNWGHWGTWNRGITWSFSHIIAEAFNRRSFIPALLVEDFFSRRFILFRFTFSLSLAVLRYYHHSKAKFPARAQNLDETYWRPVGKKTRGFDFIFI